MVVSRYTLRLCLLAAAFCTAVNAQEPDTFKDPLDFSAASVARPERAPLNDVTFTRERLVAVGTRGLIIYSDDGGEQWTQAQVPVSSDLLAVDFPGGDQGWAVGHDGVVLHSTDRGQTWIKQYDGRLAERQLSEHYQKLADNGDEHASAILEGVRLNYQDGPEQALMGVWFADENNGFVAGTFGTLLATHDGGKTWESWMERVDNPEFLHYLAISGRGDQIYMASERGTVFKLNVQTQRFEPLETGYSGTFFAIDVDTDGVVAAGLRGTVYRSLDNGLHWVQIPTGISTALSAVRAVGEGRFVAASVDGRVLLSNAQATGFTPLAGIRPGRFSSFAQSPEGKSVTVGFSGVRTISLH